MMSAPAPLTCGRHTPEHQSLRRLTLPEQPNAWPACVRAGSSLVAYSVLIDLTALIAPAAISLAAPTLPAALRLTLVALSLLLALALPYAHCLHGRGPGGLLLGLRTVDDDAGLPPGSPAALRAVLRGGRGAGATVYSTRRGSDPSVGTLQELQTASAQASTRKAGTADTTATAETTRATVPDRRTTRRALRLASKEGTRGRRRRAKQATVESWPPRPAASPPSVAAPQPAQAAPAVPAAPVYGIMPTPPPTGTAAPAPPGLASPAPSTSPTSGEQAPKDYAVQTPVSSTAVMEPVRENARTTVYGVSAPRGLRLTSTNGWEAVITGPTVLGRGPLPQPDRGVYSVLAVPDLGRQCAANHVILSPAHGGATITDLGSAFSTAILVPGSPPTFCPSGGTWDVLTPFTLTLGGMALKVTQE